MKKRFKIAAFLFVGLMTVGTTFTSCSDDDDNVIENVINESQLPDAAKTFLSTYYPSVKISKVEKERIGSVIVYDVNLTNGQEVTFDDKGDWTEVDAPDGQTIPDGILPEPIKTYLDTYYVDYGVNDITKSNNGYEVELVTGVDLLFDSQGNFESLGY